MDKQFWKILPIFSLAVLAGHSALPTYSAMEASEGPVDSPARVERPSAVEVKGINRKPAVEPRVYIESANSPTGYTYYDYADQTPSREQHAPSKR